MHSRVSGTPYGFLSSFALPQFCFYPPYHCWPTCEVFFGWGIYNMAFRRYSVSGFIFCFVCMCMCMFFFFTVWCMSSLDCLDIDRNATVICIFGAGCVVNSCTMVEASWKEKYSRILVQWFLNESMIVRYFLDLVFLEPTAERRVLVFTSSWFYVWLQTPRRPLFFYYLVLTTLANQLPFFSGVDKLEGPPLWWGADHQAIW